MNGKPIPKETVLRYAAEMEGHADNVGAALIGGFVVTFTRSDGTVVAVRKRWPKMIRLIVVTPAMTLETKKSRAVLPQTVSRADAVHNLAAHRAIRGGARRAPLRSAMGCDAGRLHQAARQALIPGLADVLAHAAHAGLAGRGAERSGPERDCAGHGSLR